MILAIETATEVCSVALKKTKDTIDERRTEEYGKHSEWLFAFINDLQQDWNFKTEELEAVLISEGPGSYTGLRIGASGVKGLLYEAATPLYAVNTLAAMSWGVNDSYRSALTIHATIDARRKHLYHQMFKGGEKGFYPLTSAGIKTLDEVRELVQAGHAIVGTGWHRLDETSLDAIDVFGADKISARNLIEMYEVPDMRQPIHNEQQNKSFQLIKQVEPADFDPRYITKKKAGT